MASRRGTILILLDEIKAAGLASTTRRLIERLGRDLDVVLVAQCYLKLGHRGRQLPAPCELYGFPAETFDADVAAFAAAIATRHAPRWVLAYGWENPQLVAALDALDLPILLVLDRVERGPHAEIQVLKVFRHVTEVVFGDGAVLESLTTARWELDARDFKVLADGGVPEEGARWDTALRRRLGLIAALSPREDQRLAHLVDAIVEAGDRCVTAQAKARENRTRDAETIAASGLFCPDLAVPPDVELPPPAAIERYLRASHLAVPRDRPFAGRLLRRPLAGFHPLIYASDNPDFEEASGEDPAAHFIRTGQPAGRWLHRVLHPDDALAAPWLTAAIHGHFHYPDLLPDFLNRLDANRSSPDLFLTTTSAERRDEIGRLLESARIKPTFLGVYPNRGRDIWSFVDLLQQGVFEPYAVVGHVHAKRSPHYAQGALWRDFLSSHIVGGPHRTIDAILASFDADPGLGVVFAEEPHLTGWEENFSLATDLAKRAGLTVPLPNHFEYPVGTMFWVRPEALSALAGLGLRLDDMPAEPLAEDGTILHALERLIPFFAAAAGFRYATTQVGGSRR